MKRGRSQATYRYLPGNYIDFDEGNCIAFVERWDSDEIKEDINKTRIISEVKTNLKRFGDTKLFRDKNKDDFVILSPRYGIDVELAPLTFICQKCGLAHSYYSVNQFGMLTKHKYVCSCGGQLKQLDLVYRHSCGYVGQVQVRSCPKHGSNNMRLVRGSSIGDWRWRCGVCGEQISLNMRCPACKSPKYIYPVPFRQSNVFQRQGFSIINLPFLDEEKLDSSDSSKLIIGEYLGLTEKYGLKTRELLNLDDNSIGSNDDESFEQDLEKWKKAGLAQEQIDLILKSTLFNKSQFNLKDVKNKILREVEKQLPLITDQLTSVAIKLFEYMETLKSNTKKHITDVIVEAEKTDSPTLSVVSNFPKIFSDIGIKHPCIIGDLSIVNVAYGFTREDEEGKNSTLNSFNWDRRDGKRLPIYINKTETEAMIFEFDRLQILNWLLKNKIIADLPTQLDEKSLKLWFLQNIKTEEINRFDEISKENTVTKAVYGLLHSITHTLLKRASSQCGLDTDSLGELIFAEIPAIIIYSNNVTSFQLGGLFTLFESKVRPWIDLAIQDIENCIYDPLCINDKGACHACLFTSEISCEHSNKDLDRRYLIGSKDLIGFWSKEFRGLK